MNEITAIIADDSFPGSRQIYSSNLKGQRISDTKDNKRA